MGFRFVETAILQVTTGRTDRVDFGRVRKCPMCGKEYILNAEDWVYKRHRNHAGDIYFCSYKCTRKYDAEHMSRPDKIRYAIRCGKSDAEICKEFNLSSIQLEYYRERTE